MFGKPMKVDTVSIFVISDKVFIPSLASYPVSVIHAEPVYVTKRDVQEMIPYIHKARVSGWEELSEPENIDEILDNAAKILTNATKTRSWKEIARLGPAYGITWLDDAIRLSVSQLDKKGRYEFPRSKNQMFPHNTPLDDILSVVLEDADRQIAERQLTLGRSKSGPTPRKP